MFAIQDTEAGNVIDTFATEKEANEALDYYESDDKSEGVYQK